MHAFRLQNFRGFTDTDWIELKPLTLLVGPNNTGKSSILRFLPLLRQSVDSPGRGPLLWSKEGGLDFGGIADVAKRGSSGTVGVSIRVTEQSFRRNTEISMQIGHSLTAPLKDMTFKMHPDTIITYNMFSSILFQGNFIPKVSLEKPHTAILPIMQLLSLQMQDWSSRVAYLGPARENPSRYYRLWDDKGQRLDPSGKNLPLVLNALSEDQRAQFNELLQSRMGYQLRLHVNGPHIEVLLRNSEGEYNLTDLGFGFSQVLPVYLQAFLGMQSEPTAEPAISVFAVEQPELHLHPRHQAQLAELFGGLTQDLNGKAPFPCFVETHSEALIDRMGELIYEKKVRQEDVQVLIFEKSGVDCTVRRTTYDTEGVLIDWPPGFLARG